MSDFSDSIFWRVNTSACVKGRCRCSSLAQGLLLQQKALFLVSDANNRQFYVWAQIKRGFDFFRLHQGPSVLNTLNSHQREDNHKRLNTYLLYICRFSGFQDTAVKLSRKVCNNVIRGVNANVKIRVRRSGSSKSCNKSLKTHPSPRHGTVGLVREIRHS